jgi:hypothetical protein
VFLGIATYIIKQVEHLVFLSGIVVGVAMELSLDLELLAKEHWILSVKEGARIREFLGSRKSRGFNQCTPFQGRTYKGGGGESLCRALIG